MDGVVETEEVNYEPSTSFQADAVNAVEIPALGEILRWRSGAALLV